MAKKRLIFLTGIVFFWFYTVPAQSYCYQTECFNTSIKTLSVIVKGNDRSYPAIELNGDLKILIQFDNLSHTSKNYSYRIIHCNADWTASDLTEDQFMDGFNQNRIQDYDFSINTKIPYVNYRVELPNDDVQLKISGNYIIEVFEEGSPEIAELTARFVLYEPIMAVNAEILRPSGAQVQDQSQELRLTLNHEQIEVTDPFSQVQVFVAQNNRPDKVMANIKPVFVRDNELVYSYSGDNIIQAGNEFRMFGFTNIHKLGLNVNEVVYVDTVYHVQLRLDERRSAKKYFWEEDLNGRFITYIENHDDTYRAADYAWVYFSLPIAEPFIDGKVYVNGSMTEWKIGTKNQMTYNFETQMYEAKLLLKQGFYDYFYTYYNNFTQIIDESILEGSHYQTENDYLIFVYYRGFATSYDRLVGYKVVNSKYQSD